MVEIDYTPPAKVGPLSRSELIEFLSRPWNARLATVTPENRPYVVPVWYQFEPDEWAFYVVGRKRSAYVAHIRVNPHVALSVADDFHREHTRVLVEGLAEVVEGPVRPNASPRLGELVLELSTRYLGPEGIRYARETMFRPRYLIRITPERLRSWTGPEWAPKYFR